MPQNPFTDRARKVIILAACEARQLGHDRLDTGHLLLGLVAEGSGVAAFVLRSLGVNFAEARREVERLLPASGFAGATNAELPHAAGVEKVVRYSLEEARSLNHNYIGTEHLLLGLLRDREETGGRVLCRLGLDIQTVRLETLRILGPTPNFISRSRPLPPHISVGPVGRVVLGLCAFLSALAFGACAVALAITLATVGPPPLVWKAVLVHLLLDLCAVAAIFMLFLAISFFTGGSRWIDPLLRKIMPKGVATVIVIVALILLAAGVVDPGLRMIVALWGFLCILAAAIILLIRRRTRPT